MENSCTEDVHENRKVYVTEFNGKVEELFLVLVNQASLNDPSKTEPFSASFRHLFIENPEGYLWISTFYVIVCVILLCIFSQVASESDEEMLFQKERYLSISEDPFMVDNKNPGKTKLDVLSEKEIETENSQLL